MENLGIVELRVGDTHTVKLESLATAGYLWSAAAQGDPRAVSVEETDEERAARAGHPARGESGDQVFVIRALAPGRTTIRFVQRRSWEQGPPARESSLEIDVKA